MAKYAPQKGDLSQYSQKPSSNTSSPYYVPSQKSGNLFQKIKGFFNKPSTQSSVPNTSQPQQLQPKKPYNFDNVNVSSIDLSVHSNMSFTSKNPNDTLSEFFNKKGDTPLNDIEIEGVLSLIKKSQNSRAPSRNTSGMFSQIIHNNKTNHSTHQQISHSMFLNNSNMDSKLSSFNDLNNTTILRPASKNMKVPVRIKTPTYVSRKSSTNNHANNTTINSSMNKSMNASNVSRSFINASGIKKRRIVDYSSLQSPYKLKNVSSLTAFLEKKKLLAKQATEEKEAKLKKEKEAADNSKSIVYTGGVIDLSHLDDDDADTDVKKLPQKSTLKPKGKDKLSKAASKVLDFLSDDVDKTVSTTEKPTEEKNRNISNVDVSKKKESKIETPKEESIEEKQDSIIAIDLDDEDEDDIQMIETDENNGVKNEEKKIPKIEEVKPLPTLNLSGSTATPDNVSETSKPVTQKSSFQANKIEKPVEEKVQIAQLFTKNGTVEGSKVDTTTKFSFGNSNQQELATSNKSDTSKPVFNFGTKFTPNSSSIPFETKPQVASKVVHEVKPIAETHIVSEVTEPDADNNDLEIIDSFVFPEVEESNEDIVLDDVSEVHKSEEKIEEDSKPESINGSVDSFNFEFPSVPVLSQQTLELLRKQPDGIYTDVFKF